MEFPTAWTGNLSRTVQLSARVYLRLGNLPVRDQCNTGIIDTGEGVVLIDYPAQNPADEIIREVREYFGKPVTHIFFTHAHGDHRNGLCGPAHPGTVLAAAKDTLQELHGQYPDLDQPVREIAPGETVCMGETGITAWSPARLPAHSPWDTLFLLSGEGVVFTGDFLVPPGFLYCFSCQAQNWVAGLESFAALSPEGILAMGHGEPAVAAFGSNTVLPYLRDLAALSDAMQERGVAVSEQAPLPLGAASHPLYGKLCGQTGSHTVRRQLRELRERTAQA